MDIGLMVEGQDGLTWERWRHILALAERLRFPTVFRSDHYFIGRHRDSLEAYLSFVLAATETTTVRFGPLVSPVTFRSPVDVGRMAAQLDLLSGGRFVMGLGAGWNEAEHRAYGIPFPPVKERMDRLSEALHVVKALWRDSPATYTGRYYRLEDADCLPKPFAGRPPILVGGSGEQRTLRLAAEHADEWNGVNISLDAYAHKRDVLAAHCDAVGRDPRTIRRSMMVFGIVGPDERALDGLTEQVMSRFGAPSGTTLPQYREMCKARGMIVGQTNEVIDLLGKYAELGLQEVEFQHLDFASDDVPEYLATEIAPRVKGF